MVPIKQFSLRLGGLLTISVGIGVGVVVIVRIQKALVNGMGSLTIVVFTLVYIGARLRGPAICVIRRFISELTDT